jgi:hypothetical protein
MRVGLLLVVAMAAVAARRHEPTPFTSDNATPPRASRRQLIGYSSTYCIQPSNATSNATLQADIACWEQQPANATACTANPNPNSTSEGCWCADALTRQCVVVSNDTSPLFNQLTYCARSTTFVAYDGVEWGDRRTLCHEQVVLGPDEWTYRPADEPAGLLLNEDAFPFWWLRCAVTPNYQWRTDDAVRWAGTEG